MSSASAAPYRIVDPHVHVWVSDPAYPWAKETTEPPKDDATPDMLLDLMQANGVARTVLVQFIGYRWDNSYALHAMKTHAPFFRSVARVNPTDDAAADHLSELTAQGFHGVRISPTADASGNWIRHARMPRLWSRAQSLKVPMQIYAPITRMPDMVPLIEQHPDLDVVIDHMADCPIDQPEQLEKLLALACYPRVFVKISHLWSISRQPYPWLDAQEYARRCYDAFGPQRLMWGTDWPVCKQWTSYEDTVRVVRDGMPWLNDDDKSWIMSRTVERVWPFAK
ncbi:MAG TPA: amidohydrolase family protein [Rhizomicrobium sp.]|jgi:predicted TIM-barrel fold metal-dependent hydrolase